MKKTNIIIFIICLLYMGYRIYDYQTEIQTIESTHQHIIERTSSELESIITEAKQLVTEFQENSNSELTSINKNFPFIINRDDFLGKVPTESFINNYPLLAQEGFTQLNIYKPCVMILNQKAPAYAYLHCDPNIAQMLEIGTSKNGIHLVAMLPKGWFLIALEEEIVSFLE